MPKTTVRLMRDSAPFTAPPAHDSDEPPSWWRRLRASVRWHSSSPETTALREAVEELIEESQAAGGSPTAERVLLANLLNLKERYVSDCMVPRGDIVAIPVSSNLKQLTDLIAEHAHSRIPAYRTTLDETVGMVHIKDVLACLAQGKDCPMSSLLRPVLFVAPSMPILKLLLQMRQTRQHMAMVVDEFGGIDGLVTIEDLVE